MNHLYGKVVRVETANEINEVMELRQRVRDLEQALTDAHVEHLLDGAYLQIACHTAGIEDVDGFKQAHTGRRLSG